MRVDSDGRARKVASTWLHFSAWNPPSIFYVQFMGEGFVYLLHGRPGWIMALEDWVWTSLHLGENLAIVKKNSNKFPVFF